MMMVVLFAARDRPDSNFPKKVKVHKLLFLLDIIPLSNVFMIE